MKHLLRCGADSRARRGMALIVGLVALALVAMLVGASLQAGLNRRRQVALDERRAQVAWLAESGLDRAVASLKDDEDYDGETWEIAPDDLATRAGAVVVIAVRQDEARPGRWLVSATAEYPRGTATPSRKTRRIVVDRASFAEGGDDA